MIVVSETLSLSMPCLNIFCIEHNLCDHCTGYADSPFAITLPLCEDGTSNFKKNYINVYCKGKFNYQRNVLLSLWLQLSVVNIIMNYKATINSPYLVISMSSLLLMQVPFIRSKVSISLKK